LLDAEPVFQRYGIRGIPCTFVIDRDGKITNRHLGYGPGMEKLLEGELQKLLAASSASR
jgi:hypothetical protein